MWNAECFKFPPSVAMRETSHVVDGAHWTK
jgi:hypothetical protein